ncbi:polyribonucleotide nucleotidyltransferase [Acidaminococcus sp. NSJ-142]|jgi:polyribonucleotide nucleotidyltransferase|uniref:polyribonucleotide nucleotidyltransferase n=1 Tax=Acidaminococcus TaxID=904 RepID=UPI000CF962A9|nr:MULTISPECIES: polyribonucleotide nucleotidyltransferase [Acidaminococcus]MCD2435022.1 polyribonucleotide nucleotidyltransferase [Acidaminococcus hominis]MCH4096263.1 polyribonucleotide nucleotidyltransferase [Acidaminococcus provencensis]
MHTFSTDLGGRTLTIETGKIAKQANGSVLVRYGDTAVVVAVTGTDTPREGVDFFPLTVDFEEKMYAVGKIPGGFLRREGRPAETAILTSRLIDRPIRPMFPEGYHNDVQIVATAVSVDPDNAPDIPAMIGASCALSISDIPFEGPIAGVRVGLIDGQFIVNPTVEQAAVSEMNLCVAGTKDAILMVEAGAKEVSEETMLDAIWFAHGEIKKLVEFQEKIQAEVGKPKMEVPVYTPPAELVEEIRLYGEDKLKAALMDADKLHREKMVDEVKMEIAEHFSELYPDNAVDVAYITQKLIKAVVRHTISVDKIRPDGRALDEVRPISCEVGLLARPHGCSLFTRGQTQVLNCLALAPLREAQTLDGLGTELVKRYIHHYNFPPYSVGETKPLRSPGRREIGHGALAERGLLPVIPSEEEFPYTIRLVSEVLESNGSSSMASVCASTLSLMDAGVPIKAPVSGVAMGLVKEGEHFTILTDIQGLEDALGDMDFKVAGTAKGITAIQMDIKIDGINKEIFQQALAQAKKGRAFILGKMLECISEPRKELKKYAPKITTLKVNPDKIKDIIGPGGKVIKKIVEETGAKIDIEDDGTVYIAAVNSESADKAIATIKGITAEPEVGKIYTGKVTRIMNFGAFVEFMPGREGLVHISQLAKERVEKVEDVVSVGDEIVVKLVEIDSKGRMNLSRKAAL